MKTTTALKALSDLTSAQWGLVTTSQAALHGVTKLDISRLAKAGHLERVIQGVYRDAGSPTSVYDEVRSYWLAARPDVLAENRLQKIESDYVASGTTASWLMGIGDLTPQKFEFVSAYRKQTARNLAQFRVAKIKSEDVEFAQGLPVTKPLIAIAELMRERTDLTLVARILSDASNKIGDMTKFRESISGLSASYGLGVNQDDALVMKLRELAGTDSFSILSKKIEEATSVFKEISDQINDSKIQTQLEQLRLEIANKKAIMSQQRAALEKIARVQR